MDPHGIAHAFFEVAGTTILVFVFLLVIVAWRLRRGTVVLHDAPALRSQATFVGLAEPASVEDDRAQMEFLAQLAQQLAGEFKLEMGEPYADEGYGSVQVRAPTHLIITFGFSGPEWLLCVTRPAFGAQPPADNPQVRSVLQSIQSALHKNPSLKNVRWHKAEALNKGDESSAAATPFG